MKKIFVIIKDLIKRKILNLNKKMGRLKTPMDMVILTLKVYQLLPHPLIALDLFGMHGLWTTADYVHYCDYLEIWEIEPIYAKFAKKFFPKTKVNIGDSIKAVQNKKLNKNKYNFIVIDNPIGGVFNEEKNYCEHFNLFPKILDYIENKTTIFVINIVINMDVIKQRGYIQPNQFNNWLKIRKNFLGGNVNIKKPNPEKLIEVYKNKFKNWGLSVNHSFFIPRNKIVGFLIIECNRK
jgi:hypothetical protein